MMKLCLCSSPANHLRLASGSGNMHWTTEEIMSAEGFESLMHLQMLQGKDAGTIRTLISGMKGHRRGYCAGMILLRYGPLTGCTMEG